MKRYLTYIVLSILWTAGTIMPGFGELFFGLPGLAILVVTGFIVSKMIESQFHKFFALMSIFLGLSSTMVIYNLVNQHPLMNGLGLAGFLLFAPLIAFGVVLFAWAVLGLAFRKTK